MLALTFHLLIDLREFPAVVVAEFNAQKKNLRSRALLYYKVGDFPCQAIFLHISGYFL